MPFPLATIPAGLITVTVQIAEGIYQNIAPEPIVKKAKQKHDQANELIERHAAHMTPYEVEQINQSAARWVL